MSKNIFIPFFFGESRVKKFRLQGEKSVRGQKEKKKTPFSPFLLPPFHSLLLLFLCFASETLFCPLFFSSSSGKRRGGEEKARNGKRGGGRRHLISVQVISSTHCPFPILEQKKRLPTTGSKDFLISRRLRFKAVSPMAIIIIICVFSLFQTASLSNSPRAWSPSPSQTTSPARGTGGTRTR